MCPRNANNAQRSDRTRCRAILGRFLLGVVVMLIAVCSAGVVKPDHPACSSPLLEPLGRSVKIFKEPAFNLSDKCKPEWSAHGTCCNPKQLVEMFNKDKANIAASTNTVAKLLVTVRKMFLGFLHKSTQNSISGILNPPSSTLTKSVKKFVGLSLFKTFEPESKKCWDLMTSIRGASLCSICSGKGAQYLHDQKMLVGLSDCNRVVEGCRGFFIDFNLFLVEMRNVSETIQKGDLSKSQLKEIKNLRQAINGLNLPTQLMSAFQQYGNSTGSAKNHAAQTICNAVLDLRREPVISRVAHGGPIILLGKLIGEFGKLVANNIKKVAQKVGKTVAKVGKKAISCLKRIGRRRRFKRACKRSRKRNLQQLQLGSRMLFGNDLSSPFQPDSLDFKADSMTVLPNQDNLFNSFVGAGSSLEQELGTARPMNLTLAFP